MCMDFLEEKLYLIYKSNEGKPKSYLDVLQVNGLQIARYDINPCLEEHGLELQQLAFILIPILKWSTRFLQVQ